MRAQIARDTPNIGRVLATGQRNTPRKWDRGWASGVAKSACNGRRECAVSGANAGLLKVGVVIDCRMRMFPTVGACFVWVLFNPGSTARMYDK